MIINAPVLLVAQPQCRYLTFPFAADPVTQQVHGHLQRIKVHRKLTGGCTKVTVDDSPEGAKRLPMRRMRRIGRLLDCGQVGEQMKQLIIHERTTQSCTLVT